MSKQDLERLGLMERLVNKELSHKEVSEKLRVGLRQVGRIKQRFLKQGVTGLIHKSRGKPSNNKKDTRKYKEALSIIKEKYHDYGPTLCKERLEEKHGICISLETLRQEMNTAGIWKIKKQKKLPPHRTARPRKESYGEMIQYDGSYHAWFENRENTKKQCLLVAIDDATGKVDVKFEENEGVSATFRFWKEYIEQTGKPVSIYLDKFASYKSNISESSDTKEVPTQFGRVCQELGIQLIFAHSPQAKGRVERMNATLQDRLVKALREENISDIATANIYLKNIFLPDFNKRFMVQAVSNNNLHMDLRTNEKERIHHIFAYKSSRVIANDFTVRFENKYYQLYRSHEKQYMIRKREKITIEKHLDQSIHISKNAILVNYTISFEKPEKQNLLTAPIYKQN